MTKLTDEGYSFAPKLMAWKQEKQEKHMPVPDGYVVYIVMEKLPGVHPLDIWNDKRCSRIERDEIRRAFREALRYVNAFLWHGYRSELTLLVRYSKVVLFPWIPDWRTSSGITRAKIGKYTYACQSFTSAIN